MVLTQLKCSHFIQENLCNLNVSEVYILRIVWNLLSACNKRAFFPSSIGIFCMLLKL